MRMFNDHKKKEKKAKMKEKKEEKKDEELILETNLDFDQVIGRLNKIAYRSKFKGGKDTLKLIEAIKNSKDKNTILDKLKAYLSVDNAYESIRNIFQVHKLEAIVGEKRLSKAFGNKSIVIGLTSDWLKYRVDYDDKEKGLHINALLCGINIAIIVNPQSRRFGTTKESGQVPEFIKFKFWVKMTLSYYLSKDDFPSAFSPFLRLEEYDFKTFKSHIMNYFDQKSDTYNLIASCNDEKEMANRVFNTEELRDTLIGHLVSEYTNHKIEIYSGKGKSEDKTSSSLEDSSASESDDSSDSDTHKRRPK